MKHCFGRSTVGMRRSSRRSGEVTWKCRDRGADALRFACDLPLEHLERPAPSPQASAHREPGRSCPDNHRLGTMNRVRAQVRPLGS